MRSFFVLLSTLWMLGSAVGAEPVMGQRDQADIRHLVQAWETAWNAHDMKLMAALLTDDADFVNVAGLHWKGKREIEVEHAKRHETNLKSSVWVTREIRLQALSGEIALAHISWSLSGDADFDGTPRAPRDGIFAWLLAKKGDRWLIRAVQNTNLSARK